MTYRSTCDGHGRYVAGCEGCRLAWRLRHRARRAFMAEQGLTLSQPAEPVRQHLVQLREGGMTARSIARASGVPIGTVNHILHRKSRRVFTHNARRLYAITGPHPAVPPGFVQATGPRRRVQALTVIGYSLKAQRLRTGMGNAVCYRLISGGSAYIGEATGRAIAEMYRDWAGKPGPSKVAITWGRKHGWVSPAAWDDIDDPAAVPVLDADPDPDYVDEEKVYRAAAGFPVGKLTGPEVVAAVCRMTATGLSLTRACDLLSVNRERVKRLLAEAEGRVAA